MHFDLAQLARLAALVSAVTILSPSLSFADYNGIGDGAGTIPAEGGPSSALIIGNTDLGGIFGDDEEVFGGVMPLDTPTAIIGNDVTGIGAVTMTGYVSQWNLEAALGATTVGDSGEQYEAGLIVGEEGQGLISLGASATVDVDRDTILGNESSGSGIIQIEGATFPAARFRNFEDLVVGRFGTGRIEVFSRGALLSEGDVVLGAEDGGDGTVVLEDSGTIWTALGNFVVGNGANGATTGHGTIEINNEALLQWHPADTAGDDDFMINPNGQIILGGGTLRRALEDPDDATEIADTVIQNDGLIMGDGFVDGDITIGFTGELRNAASIANEREYLQVSGTVSNSGLIESQGGELYFESDVVNNGVIFGRDAILRFHGGDATSSADLINNQQIILDGDTTLYGDIDNPLGTGTITTIPSNTGSIPTIIGNVTFTSTSPLVAASTSATAEAVTLPSTGLSLASELLILGELNLGSSPAELAFEFEFDGATELGDVVQVLSATEGVSGSFANEQVIANEWFWDIGYSGDNIYVTASGVVGSADFNNDGIVDGDDFLVWLRGYSLGTYDDSDLLAWQDQFGTAGVLATAAAIPEPSSIMLLMLGLGLSVRRQHRT